MRCTPATRQSNRTILAESCACAKFLAHLVPDLPGSSMRHHRRPVHHRAVAIVVPLAFLLAACGGADSSGRASGADPSADPAATSSPSTAPSPTSASLQPSTSPSVCSPPAAVYRYTRGSAQIHLSGDLGEGTSDLTLDTSGSYANHYLPDDGGITLNYSDASGTLLTFDIGGIAPNRCVPDTFTSITVELARTFVDPSHTQCAVHVNEIRADGIEGTYECDGLSGGGEGVTIDAYGFFSAA